MASAQQVSQLRIEMPLFKLDRRVGMNSNLNRWSKQELSNQIRDICTTLTRTQVNFGNLEEQVKELTSPENWPLVMLCERHYKGRGKPMDRDNLASCFKHHIDGILIGIGFVSHAINKKGETVIIPIDDEAHFKPVYEQIAEAKENMLVFTIMPEQAWEALELKRLLEKAQARLQQETDNEKAGTTDENAGNKGEKNLDLQTTWL